MTDLISQALRVSQEYDLAIFPVSSSKRPILKGWRDRATRDPDEIRHMFGLPGAAGIGVPCGPDNDIICFDLDYGHTDDPDRIRKLEAWQDGFLSCFSDGSVMVRQTRSGGLHILTSWPERGKPPRRIMPKLDVIIEGFYFVWWMEGGGYRHVSGDLTSASPSPALFEIVERDTLGSGSALMTAEEAHEAMWSDGDSGQRHDALLRMTKDWVDEHPDDTLEELCSGFEDWCRDIYADRIDPERLDKLLEWDVDDERGELYRAFKGAHRDSSRGVTDDLVAKAAAKMKERGAKPTVSQMSTAIGRAEAKAARRIEGDLFSVYDPENVGEPAPWLIPNLLREMGTAAFVGMSGVGKTTLTASWTIGMLSGRTDVVGLPAIERPLNVAWLNAEEEAADMMDHVRVASEVHGLQAQGKLLVLGEEKADISKDGISLVVKRFNKELRTSELVINEELVDKLVEEVEAAGIDVMIVDPVTEFNDGQENDRGDAKILHRAFRMIAQRARVAVMYWAHTGQPPASAKPDWYKNDMFAQRGSSQNIGSVKTMGTVWHLTPPSLKSGEAWGWVRLAKNAQSLTPNLIKVTVIKIKKSPVFYSQIYELRPSAIDEDIPVCFPMTEEEATQRMEGLHGDLMVVATATKLIADVLGEGRHDRGVINKNLSGRQGWYGSDLRYDRNEHRQFIDHWQHGQETTIDGAKYVVSSSAAAGSKAGFTFTVRRVS